MNKGAGGTAGRSGGAPRDTKINKKPLGFGRGCRGTNYGKSQGPRDAPSGDYGPARFAPSRHQALPLKPEVKCSSISRSPPPSPPNYRSKHDISRGSGSDGNRSPNPRRTNNQTTPTKHSSCHDSSNYSPSNNPKNKVLSRARMMGMRSVVGGDVSPSKLSHRNVAPLGSKTCFNFSYKEPIIRKSSNTDRVQMATEYLTEGKHVLDPQGTGVVTYVRQFYEKNRADKLFYALLNSLNFESCKNKSGTVVQPRLSVWFGPEDKPYSYSYVTLYPHSFTSNRYMLQIKQDVEALFGCTFNCCLVNLYRDGKDGVGWHADDEPSLGPNPTIGSVSLGEVRRFEFCEKGDEERRARFGFHLEHGSVLLMKGDVQERWLHRVPTEYHDRKGRINLTFRTIYTSDNY